jgi:hypothetical protein
MASFSTFKTLEDALLHFKIVENRKKIFPSIHNSQVIPASLVEELEFNMSEMPYNESEASLCEMIIFPILKTVWKNFRQKLLLWSHRSLGKNADISGIPDYIIAKRSQYGRVMDLPFLVMIEAKKDNFDEGWGQCLAQMITAQSLNKDEEKIYGIVTNGKFWEFGQLVEHTFTKHSESYSLQDLNTLYNTLYYLLELCEKRVV